MNLQFRIKLYTYRKMKEKEMQLLFDQFDNTDEKLINNRTRGKGKVVVTCYETWTKSAFHLSNHRTKHANKEIIRPVAAAREMTARGISLMTTVRVLSHQRCSLLACHYLQRGTQSFITSSQPFVPPPFILSVLLLLLACAPSSFHVDFFSFFPFSFFSVTYLATSMEEFNF